MIHDISYTSSFPPIQIYDRRISSENIIQGISPYAASLAQNQDLTEKQKKIKNISFLAISILSSIATTYLLLNYIYYPLQCKYSDMNYIYYPLQCDYSESISIFKLKTIFLGLGNATYYFLFNKIYLHLLSLKYRKSLKFLPFIFLNFIGNTIVISSFFSPRCFEDLFPIIASASVGITSASTIKIVFNLFQFYDSFFNSLEPTSLSNKDLSFSQCGCIMGIIVSEIMNLRPLIFNCPTLDSKALHATKYFFGLLIGSFLQSACSFFATSLIGSAIQKISNKLLERKRRI